MSLHQIKCIVILINDDTGEGNEQYMGGHSIKKGGCPLHETWENGVFVNNKK